MTLEQAFTVRDTHGILMRPEHTIRSRSDGFGWTSLYASIQHEAPYEGSFDPVEDQLIVLHMDGPVTIEAPHGARTERCTVPAGGIHLIPGGESFGIRLFDPLTTMHLYIRRSVMEEVARQVLRGDPRRTAIPAQFIDGEPALDNILAAIRYELVSGNAAGNLSIDYMSRALAFNLLRRYSGAAPLPSAFMAGPRRATASVRRALDYMNDNLREAISLDDLAGAARRSASHLARSFNAELGMPPHRYLIMLRLKRAQALLRTTRLPLGRIAAECGLSSREHLIKLFRRWCETTPEAYRQSFLN